MTADQFEEVDRDLLADYVGGALDGTLEQVMVRRLIAERPTWRAAHDELVDASQLVRGMLAEWGSGVEPIPQGVADRINAALAAEPPAGVLTGADTSPLRTSAGKSSPSSVPNASPTPTPTPTPLAAARARRAGRRWQRFAAPIAVAAAAAAFAGFGLSHLLGGEVATDSSTTAGGAPESDTGPQTAEGDGPANTMMEPSPPRVTFSGTDYRRATIAAAAADRTGTDFGQPAPGDDTVLQEPPSSVAEPLRRLAEPAALADCLAAVTSAHGNGVLGVGLVDFAAFEGAAAVIMTFTDSSGASWVWVSGPDCGTPSAGADTRYSTQVG
ncbi:hypothetical protein [Micromonospora sp. NBC_01813]|uniref:hypothetical protein n=1 Tax=Micromonospora sp. NBC_01813 TaxID=2975988 RepID=UPI002DD95369|nr:hypothetical protein [Micromonospora sp. NBC_01813]WSA07559.1 hypothetical protein OG958_25440 [Micromonospora sp. NBC_01813]